MIRPSLLLFIQLIMYDIILLRTTLMFQVVAVDTWCNMEIQVEVYFLILMVVIQLLFKEI